MKRLFLIVLILSAAANLHAQFARTDPLVEQRLIWLKRSVEPLYRKPTAKELEAVKPSPALFERYGGFLRRSDTGLVKLIDDKGCADNTKIVVATDNCLLYTMPGGGSSFSFRTENYRLARLSDILFTARSFQASGALLHGIFVNLGDVPLDEVTLETRGLKYLRNFQPEPDYEKGKALDAALTKGIVDDGFLYRRGLFMVENTTFALRSIAYNGKYFRALDRVTYNEFDFDKRKDVIVVFRIVEKDDAGNVTILWKKLQEKDSPEVKGWMK